MNKKTRFKEPLEINIPPEEVQRKVEYLRKNGVPIDELILVLSRAYQENWKNGKDSSPKRDDVRDWFVEKGCTKSLARTLQELIRPQRYQGNQNIDDGVPIKKAAYRIWEDSERISCNRRAHRMESITQKLRENNKRLRDKCIKCAHAGCIKSEL